MKNADNGTAASSVTVSRLIKKYSGVEVLQNINFTVDAGQFVTIVGPSGCGKTTLLRIINGLDIADSGTVQIGGQRVAGPMQECAFVFQADSLMPWRTVFGNAKIGLELRGVKKAETSSRLGQMLQLVGLQGYEKFYPRQLSGGMKQRVNLARALAVDPDVLLMDEPFAALDAQTREIMQKELLRIWSAGDQKTVVFITHQLDEAVYLADRVLVMGRNPGRIVEDIVIPFPRPRDLSMKRTEQFGRYVDRIWQMIEGAVEDTQGI